VIVELIALTSIAKFVLAFNATKSLAFVAALLTINVRASNEVALPKLLFKFAAVSLAIVAVTTPLVFLFKIVFAFAMFAVITYSLLHNLMSVVILCTCKSYKFTICTTYCCYT
jgi:hypothetical protein